MPYSTATALQLFLQRLSSRTPLGPVEMNAILALTGETVTAHGDRDLVAPGEQVEHACLITSGLVGRFGQMRDGRRQITAFFLPGHMANLQSVVFPSSAASLQALTQTTAIKLPHAALKAAADAHPELANAFWRECAVDGSVLEQWVINARKSAIGRLSHLLAELGLRMEEAGLGTHLSFPLPATQLHIGDALGLTQVHVNRVFRDLRNARILKASRRAVEICDWDELVRIGEFNPDYLHLDTKDWTIPSSNSDGAFQSLSPEQSLPIAAR